MLALHANDPSSGLKLETVEIPSLGPRDILIKVSTAGITPGVLKLLKQGRGLTLTTIGHEAAGTAAAIGRDVPDLTVNTRVRVHPTLSCGACHHCDHKRDQICHEAALIGFARFGKESVLYDTYHDGSLAEYIRVPYWLLETLPTNVSFDVAAKIHDAATALSALKLAELPRDSTIVITAATGTMGTLTLRLAQQFPIKRVILLGRSKERLESVRGLTSLETAILSLGDQCSKNADGHMIGALVPQLKEMAPDGINAIIDWLPSGDVIGQILPALSTGGTVIHMGGNASPLPIPLVVIMANCWRLVGSRANTREDTSQILAWLAEGRIDIADLITHRFNLKEIDKALEVMESRSEPVWLSVIQIST